MNTSIGVNQDSGRNLRSEKSAESALVAAAAGGDRAAFEALTHRYRGFVLAVTRRMTRSMEDAEDLTQQAFMKAYANLSQFGNRCSFSTWLITIAINEARGWHRKAQRRCEVAITELCSAETADMPVEFVDERPNPEATYLDREWRRLLASELDRLNPGTRDALRMCDIDEKTNVSAATLLGVTPNAVKSRRLRGRAVLRQRLEPQLFALDRRAGATAGYRMRSL